ncbi:HD domain-containing protein [Haloplasma contractile]|uniref:HD superfamily hydrolase protein n=1 Tax=Haloplasma contractile SSD-17B TaxID=1033810 RepID=U2E818_9MOLU|nr:HD domain-containing protein [Haloplasma contractile]ERJ11011.1 HD superfamily hydrolase protein [Haloplasma contractile SSD-17B]
MLKEKVIVEMKEVFHDMPKGIDHTLNVLQYAESIMDKEMLSNEEKEMISITAILHDVGIPEAKRKYGSSKGEYQEREGAIIAGNILDRIEYDSERANRVCYIVGNHHTKSKINGLDFQIIWEADMLVNLENNKLSQEELKECIKDNFKTDLGIKLAYEKYIDG